MGAIRNRGSKSEPAWYIRFRDHDGRWKERHSKQPTKEATRSWLAEVEARVGRGLPGIADPTPAERTRLTVTVTELASRFLGDTEGDPGYRPPKLKDLQSYRNNARSVFTVRVLPTLGPRAAAAVRPMDVERLRDAEIARGLKPASVVQTLATLSKLYNWARRAEYLDCPNPVAGVERPRPVPSLDYLSAAEVGQLLAGAEDLARLGVASWQSMVLYPMIATAIYCGLRKGELFGLRWQDVQIDAKRLDVWRSYKLLPKGGKPRHVPINPELAPLLRAWRKVCPATPDGLAFPVDGSRMGAKEENSGLTDLMQRTECHAPADGKPWHMLRHTFAAHAVMSGTTLYAVQKLLGHSTPIMTQRYAHLAPDYMASEVARMSFARPQASDIADLTEERRRRQAEAEE